MKIFKYSILMLAKPFELDLKQDAEIVKVAQDANGVSVFWATVPRDGIEVKRTFLVVGTGFEIPEEFNTYRGTWLQGRFVWHLLEKV